LCIIQHTQNRFFKRCWARFAGSGKAKSKNRQEEQENRQGKQGHKGEYARSVKLPCSAISPDLKGTGDDALNSVDKEEKPAIHNREALEQ
jgi:hypothetical protein